jgi:2-amino-4-hydroxy-6-hydroxymethyldihydropteridine diphosphokinase
VSRAVLSIGSNLGDRLARLAGVVSALRVVGTTVKASPVYETAPWGPVEQDDYLNAVVVAEVAGPYDWLGFVRTAEKAAERVREVHWGPRTLDVDVVQVTSDAGDVLVSDDPELTLPHPRTHQRAFVLVPWLAVDPDAVLAGHGSVRELIAALPDDERNGVRRRDDLSLER